MAEITLSIDFSRVRTLYLTTTDSVKVEILRNS